jgi:hypothetical protein
MEVLTMDAAQSATEEVFLTDAQLRKRWQCSAMKLWRLRQQGKLKSVKIGGAGTNLTPASEVKALEVAARRLVPEAA